MFTDQFKYLLQKTKQKTTKAKPHINLVKTAVPFIAVPKSNFLFLCSTLGETTSNYKLIQKGIVYISLETIPSLLRLLFLELK